MPAFLIDKQMVVWYTKSSEKVVLLFDANMQIAKNSIGFESAVYETIAVEFKRCGNGIESDVYETVCSFLNRFGGDIFLGVLDDGTVLGVPEKAAPD